MTDFNQEVEAMFRKAFQEGAHEALKALQTHSYEEVRRWIDVDLAAWRWTTDTGRKVLPPLLP